MPHALSPLKSIVWNHGGKLADYGATFVTAVLVARALGVEANGALAGVLAIAQLLVALGSFGLETALNRFLPQLSTSSRVEEVRYLVRRTLLLRLGLAAIVGMVFFATLLWIPDDPAAQWAWILVALMILRSLIPLLAMVLTSQLRTDRTALINGAIRLAELTAVALLGARLTIHIVLALFAVTSALQLMLYLVASKDYVIGPEREVPLGAFMGFGAVYWINTLVDYFLGRQGDILLLSRMLPNGTQASLYDVASSLVRLAVLGSTVGLGGLSLVALARTATHAPSALKSLYEFMIRMMSLLTLPVFAFLLFNGDAVIHVLYAAPYAAAIPLLQGLLLFRIASRLVGAPENADYLLARGKARTVVAIGACGAALNLVLDVVLIPPMGAWGAVVATGIANLGVNSAGAARVYKMSGGKPQGWYWFRITAICLAASFFTSAVIPSYSTTGLTSRIVLYFVILTVLLIPAKPFGKDDVPWLDKLDSRLSQFLSPFVRHGTS